MKEHDQFTVNIYHDGCEIAMPVHGFDRYRQEKAFLNELVGLREAALEVYPLDDAQFDAYLDFRKSLQESG
jgi:hypothetical protein